MLSNDGIGKKVKINDECKTDVLNQTTIENHNPKHLTTKLSKDSSFSNISQIVKPTRINSNTKLKKSFKINNSYSSFHDKNFNLTQSIGGVTKKSVNTPNKSVNISHD